MLQIQDCTIRLKQQDQTIISNLSFQLSQNDKLAIISEEGCGKSTLLKWIVQDDQVFSYAEISGNVFPKPKSIGYLPQSLPKQFEEVGVYDYLSQCPGFYDALMCELAIPCQLNFDLLYSQQKLKTLSGGEKIKVQMLYLMMKQPEFYVLDEPSNDLDLTSQKWLADWIGHCAQPVLFVTHDEALLQQCATAILHLEINHKRQTNHYIWMKCSYMEYKEKRQRQFDHQWQVAKSQHREKQKRDEKLLQIRQKVEHQLRTITRADAHGGQLLKKKMKAITSQENRNEKLDQQMVELPDQEVVLSFQFDPSITLASNKKVYDIDLHQLQIDEKILARNIHFQMYGPKKIGIIGDNGVGKSTFLKTLAELKKDLQIGYMPQNYLDIYDGQANILSYFAQDKQTQTLVRQYLGAMGFGSRHMEKALSQLSLGQMAKFLFLKMHMDQCSVLLLDEPTRHFSPTSQQVIRQALQDFQGGIVMVSHDQLLLDQVAQEIFQLTKDGLIQIR